VEKQLYTIQEAARESGVSEGNIRVKIQRGTVKARRMGRGVYIERGEVIRLKEGQAVASSL
jgi:excisionase family DNA binding protein